MADILISAEPEQPSSFSSATITASDLLKGTITAEAMAKGTEWIKACNFTVTPDYSQLETRLDNLVAIRKALIENNELPKSSALAFDRVVLNLMKKKTKKELK